MLCANATISNNSLKNLVPNHNLVAALINNLSVHKQIQVALIIYNSVH